MARIWSYRAGLTGVVNEPSYRAQLPGKYKQAVITQYASRHVFMKGEKELSWQLEQPLRCSRTNAVRSRCVEPVQNFVARIAQHFQGRFLQNENQLEVGALDIAKIRQPKVQLLVRAALGQFDGQGRDVISPESGFAA